MNKKIFIWLAIVLFFIVLGVFGVNSLVLDNSYDLVQGKNIVTFNEINPFYVEDLIKLNPEIEVVSYNGDERTIGYVNIYGGLGTNFVIRDATYEIIVKGNTTLFLPNN